MDPPAEVADEMAVDAKQSMLNHEKQAINHFGRTTDEIMVIIFYLNWFLSVKLAGNCKE